MRLPFLLTLLTLSLHPMAQPRQSPDELYGQLFADVQKARIFADGKTFADAIPKREPAAIRADYDSIKANPAIRFSLELFVDDNFYLPQKPLSDFAAETADLETHINRLWHVLHRKADSTASGSSLLPLPFEYVVPGGRFREIYYWDTYFTMLGLQESGELQMIENLVRNFAWLIDTYGHIPNGNRTYYLSRSQPPFFSLMVELLAKSKGDRIYTDYLPQLHREHAYWMDRTAPTRHVVTMPDGSLLNRYWDQRETPRPESHYEDVHEAPAAPGSKPAFYRDIRSAAESGWDFSSRWFDDGKSLRTIRTTSFVPVDLNCLLVHLETTIARGLRMKELSDSALRYDRMAELRRRAILRYCWSERMGWFNDYDLKHSSTARTPTLAGMFPFFLGLADKRQMQRAKPLLQQQFLKAGGVVSTLRYTREQWDAPNGWAPLQWVTIEGLERYGERSLAGTIARRWIMLNRRVFKETGKLMEKYDVVNANKPGGGGEYPAQDGFGWTNGVLLALIKRYGW